MRIFFSLIVICSMTFGTAFAKTKAEDLKQTQKKLSQIKKIKNTTQKNTTTIKKEILSIKKSSRDLAKRTQEYDSQLLLLKENIDALSSQTSKIKKQLNIATRDLMGIISTMQRVSKNPENALLLYPGTPAEAIKSTALLKSILPQINNKRVFIEKNLKDLEIINQDLLGKKKTFQKKSIELSKVQGDLQKKLNKKTILQRKIIKKSKALKNKEKKLLAKIKTIKNFLERIKIEENARKKQIRKTKPKNIKRFPARGKIRVPAIGRLIKAFNQRNESGKRNTGITIKTRSNSNVVTPFDGYVSYAGHFGNLGKVVIISHEGGYNSVLVGLNSTYVNTGVWVLTGEPIGKMGKIKNTLHIEIRYGQKPLNPLRWMNKHKFKGK